jgi:hypothetical protein
MCAPRMTVVGDGWSVALPVVQLVVLPLAVLLSSFA